MKIKFVGDHTNCHCGSGAVADFFQKTLSRQGEIVDKKAKTYDVLVVNGEGSMHHNSGPFQKKMRFLEQATDAGIAAYLVNTVWQDNPLSFDGILKHLRQIIVREKRSLDELKQKHGITAEISIDFAYFAPVEQVPPAINFHGEIATTDFFSAEFGSFAKITSGPLSKHEFLPMREMTWSQCVASLRTASLLMCGRHHGIYAACKARVPFVAFRGNSHKIEGIFDHAGIPIPVCQSFSELPDATEWAKAHPEAYQNLFDWMDAQKPWGGIE